MKMVVEIQEDPETGELILPVSNSILSDLEWEVGESLVWSENEDGTFTVRKIDWRNYIQ